MQVGPLPRMLAWPGAGPRTDHPLEYATAPLDLVSTVAGTKVGVEARDSSTIGRHAARAVGCAVQVDEPLNHWDLLLANMARAT